MATFNVIRTEDNPQRRIKDTVEAGDELLATIEATDFDEAVLFIELVYKAKLSPTSATAVSGASFV